MHHRWLVTTLLLASCQGPAPIPSRVPATETTVVAIASASSLAPVPASAPATVASVASAPPPTAAPAPARHDCPAGTTPVAGGAPWSQLVQRDACVVLHSHRPGEEDPDERFRIVSRDVRRIGQADVARLSYTLLQGDTATEIGQRELLPMQVAVSRAGVYVFDEPVTDKDIAAALRKPPHLTAAMKRTQPTAKNRYLFRFSITTRQGTATCLGKAIPRSLNVCEDTCDGAVCVSPTGGIVLIEGVAAPAFGSFMRPGHELLPGP